MWDGCVKEYERGDRCNDVMIREWEGFSFLEYMGDTNLDMLGTPFVLPTTLTLTRLTSTTDKTITYTTRG